jgi:hypothetical protein
MDLYKQAKKFNIGHAEKISKVSILYYHDEYGNIFDGNEIHRIIARVLFEKLPETDQIELFNIWSEYDE